MDFVDLTGEECPMFFVRVMLRMHETPAGGGAGFIVSDGPQLRDVRRSAEADGHRVEPVGRDGGRNFILIWKDGMHGRAWPEA